MQFACRFQIYPLRNKVEDFLQFSINHKIIDQYLLEFDKSYSTNEEMYDGSNK